MSSRLLRDRRPAFLLVPGVLAIALLTVPVIALVGEVPWSAFGGIVTSPIALEALRLSIITSVAATGVAFVIGMPLAALLAHDTLPFTRVVRALVVVPLLMPPVVSGVALLAAFGRRGFVGGPLDDWFGVQLPFTTVGVVLAEAFVAMPFLVITLEAALRSLDSEFEETAATLGAGAWTTFRRVTVPLVAPALSAGLVLAWARALGEFGATITFAGNMPGVTQTMPLAVYSALESDRDVAIALSVLLLAVSVSVLVALRGNYLGAMRASR